MRLMWNYSCSAIKGELRKPFEICKAAMKNLNGSMVDESVIRVKKAEPK